MKKLEDLFKHFFPGDSNDRLRPNTVHIWFLQEPEQVYLEKLSADLIPEERQSIAQFKFAKDRLIRTYSRGLLRHFIARELSSVPQKVGIASGKYGKPILLDQSLHFNVSHSGDVLLFALSKSGPIGVDVEEWKSFDYVQTARTVFSEAEQRSLARLDGEEMKKAFFHGWARKEAFIKAIGQGISFPLKELSVDLNSTIPFSEPIRFTSEELKGHRLCSLDCPKGYSSAACFPSDIEHVVFHEKKGTSNYTL